MKTMGAKIAASYRKPRNYAAKICNCGEEKLFGTEVSQRMVQLFPRKKFCRAQHTRARFLCATIGSVHKEFLSHFSVT
jgi:hypothetical protein